MSVPQGLPDRQDGPQRLEWFLQRVGWALWALVLVAGLAGLLGSGPLSSTESISADGTLAVSYDRYLHYHSPSSWKLTLKPEEATGEFEVEIARSLLDAVEVQRVEPEPFKCELRDDSVVYSFHLSPGASTGHVVVHLEYDQFGTAAGFIRLGDSEPVRVEQFAYP